MKRIPFFLALIAGLAACGKEAAPPSKVEPLAMTQVAGAVAADRHNTYSGEIRARYEIPLGFRIGGKIVERKVDVGAVVKAGQALARLDAADAALQANQAEAQYQLAEADAKRFRDLRSRNFVSQSALDAKETALKAAAAQTGLARNQSTYTLLRADRAGVVAAVLAEPGQVVSAGQPVLRLAQDGEREVAIAIPETQIARLKVGASAEVTLWAEGSERVRLSGRLRELAPAADPASRTYPARVALADSKTPPPLGMTAQVHFNSGDKNTELIVPLSAIFQQGEQPALWIVAADRSIQLRPVQVSAYRGDGAVIRSGLAHGERFVSAGVHKLTGGEKIRLIERSDNAR